MNNLISKIKWRVDFLQSPSRCVTRSERWREVTHRPLREALYRDMERCPPGERFRLICRGSDRSSPLNVDHWLLNRLRTAEDGERYFDLADRRIFFAVPDQPVDPERQLEGILLILKEAFIWESCFFRGDVRIHAGDVVLDLGGNVGTSAMYFAPLVAPGGHVYSFEPIHHVPLQRNLQQNLVTNVTVIPAAVGASSGEISFDVTDAGIDARIAGDGSRAKQTVVPMTTLDDFVTEHKLERLDFIKMDIEGAEEMALQGGMETLRRFGPKLSIASYHTDPTGEKQHPKLKRILQDLGYNVSEIPGKHLYAIKGTDSSVPFFTD